MKRKEFKYFKYLWDFQTASNLHSDEVTLLIYRFNLVGADLRLTNYGGGNTSCKVSSMDPLTKKSVEVMWVSRSGVELGTMKKRLATLNLDRLHHLQNIYKGLAYEDEIAGSNIWSGGWAEGRTKAYGITIEDLPAYYAGRTLLNEIILPEDIANTCFAYVGGLLNKSTGNMINADGGIAMSFVR